VRISVARRRVDRMFSSRLARLVRSQIAVAVAIGSWRQRCEEDLRFRDLGKFRGRRKALERGREYGMSVLGTAGGTIKSCQIESGAQLKTLRLPLLRNGDCCKERILGRRRIRRIAREQNLAAAAMQESVAPVFSRLACEG
jgi:hypothetical protein